MPRGKKVPVKKISSKKQEVPEEEKSLNLDVEESDSDSTEKFPSKVKKVEVPLEDADDVLPSDIKAIDPIIADIEPSEEEESDDLGLDDEEIDPFGDKWEA